MKRQVEVDDALDDGGLYEASESCREAFENPAQSLEKASRATELARHDVLSGVQKRLAPQNPFATKARQENVMNDVAIVDPPKDVTPAAVRRYKKRTLEEGDDGAQKPDDAFRRIMTKSAFFQVQPKSGRKARSPAVSSGPRSSKKEESEPARGASAVQLEHGLLSGEQRQVLEAVSEGRNVFFTGSAGVGKSFTLRVLIGDLRRRFHESSVFVTASTGIAATHIGGTTLHSFAGVGLGAASVEQAVAKVKNNKVARERWQSCRVLVIDEISMIGASFFELLDAVGQSVRSSSRPFGGIQVVVTGDFLQLPPVDRKGEETYVFESESWKSAIDVSIELTQVFRQKNQVFVELLQALRVGRVSDEHDRVLQSRMHARLSTENGVLPTRLYTHRDSVERENEVQLNALTGRAFVFVAKDTGDDYTKEMLAKNCMAPATLKLKLGAQVMLLKNLDPPLLVNGSRGRVVGFERMTAASVSEEERKRSKAQVEDREYPKVRFDNGQELVLTPQAWEVERGGVVMATRAQVPLCLAWALSVHKCQGMTIDKVEVDVAASWDAGQAYVALSRCTSLEGLSLLGYRRDKIRAHPKVLEFYAKLHSGAVKADTRTIRRFAK
jgi:ATP-dependent DNA helicase PIF1